MATDFYVCTNKATSTPQCAALSDGIGTAEQHTYRENELSAGAHIKFGCQSDYASIRIIIYGARPLNQGTVCNFPCNATCEHFKALRCEAMCVCFFSLVLLLILCISDAIFNRRAEKC